jgi:hypothetical protein
MSTILSLWICCHILQLSIIRTVESTCYYLKHRCAGVGFEGCTVSVSDQVDSVGTFFVQLKRNEIGLHNATALFVAACVHPFKRIFAKRRSRFIRLVDTQPIVRDYNVQSVRGKRQNQKGSDHTRKKEIITTKLTRVAVLQFSNH